MVLKPLLAVALSLTLTGALGAHEVGGAHTAPATAVRGAGPALVELQPAPESWATAMRQVVGETIRGEMSDHFVFAHAADPAWIRHTAAMLEETHASFYTSFQNAGFTPQPLEHRLVWVCFDHSSAYDTYARRADRIDMSWAQAYYSARTNRVAVLNGQAASLAVNGGPTPAAANDGVVLGLPQSGQTAVLDQYDRAKMTHEAAHQLAFNSGLQTRGVMYPLWATEGLATNFEANEDGRTGLDADNPLRRSQLLSAWRAGRLQPLSDFACLTRVPVGQPRQISDLYAQSWGFFRFLYERRREQLVNYYDGLRHLDKGWRNDAALRQDAVRFFGSPEQLERDWQQYLEDMDRRDSRP